MQAVVLNESKLHELVVVAYRDLVDEGSPDLEKLVTSGVKIHKFLQQEEVLKQLSDSAPIAYVNQQGLFSLALGCSAIYSAHNYSAYELINALSSFSRAITDYLGGLGDEKLAALGLT